MENFRNFLLFKVWSKLRLTDGPFTRAERTCSLNRRQLVFGQDQSEKSSCQWQNLESRQSNERWMADVFAQERDRSRDRAATACRECLRVWLLPEMQRPILLPTTHTPSTATVIGRTLPFSGTGTPVLIITTVMDDDWPFLSLKDRYRLSKCCFRQLSSRIRGWSTWSSRSGTSNPLEKSGRARNLI